MTLYLINLIRFWFDSHKLWKIQTSMATKFTSTYIYGFMLALTSKEEDEHGFHILQVSEGSHKHLISYY